MKINIISQTLKATHKNPVNQVTANRDTKSCYTHAFCQYMQIQQASDQVPIGDSNFTYPGHMKFIHTLSIQPKFYTLTI